MEKTVPHPYLGKEFIGYVVNTEISSAGQLVIANLAQKFEIKFNGMFLMPQPETLHITLMDWLAPLVDYDRDKDEIFKEIYVKYDKAVQSSIGGIGPIDVRFNKIAVSPEAVFLIGHDDGQYQTIRDKFLNQVTLLPNTKMPPKIIHTTIARFSKVAELEPIRNFATAQSISFNETIKNFRLMRSTDTIMEAKKIIKRYYLK